MSTENTVSNKRREFKWDPERKTVVEHNPAGTDPNTIVVGPEDSEFFGSERN